MTYRKQLTFNNAEKDLWEYIHTQNMPAASFIKMAIREYMKKQEIKEIVEEVLAEKASTIVEEAPTQETVPAEKEGNFSPTVVFIR